MTETFQGLIYKLRKGDFQALIDFQNLIVNKYSSILNETLGGDHIILLMINELIRTDLNQSDLTQIKHLLHRIKELTDNNVITPSSDADNALLTTVGTSCCVALVLKEKDNFIILPEIQSKEDIENLVNNPGTNHPFHILLKTDESLIEEQTRLFFNNTLDKKPSDDDLKNQDTFILSRNLRSLDIDKYKKFSDGSVLNEMLNIKITSAPMFGALSNTIKHIEQSATDLRKRHKINAADAASRLSTNIKLAAANYISYPKTLKNLIEFETACQKYILLAKPFLEKYRGPRQYLENFLFGLCTLCIGYLILWWKERDLLSKTASSQILNDLSDDISNINFMDDVCKDDINNVDAYISILNKRSDKSSDIQVKKLKTLEKIKEILSSSTNSSIHKHDAILQLVQTDVKSALIIMALEDLINDFILQLKISDVDNNLALQLQIGLNDMLAILSSKESASAKLLLINTKYIAMMEVSDNTLNSPAGQVKKDIQLHEKTNASFNFFKDEYRKIDTKIHEDDQETPKFGI